MRAAARKMSELDARKLEEIHALLDQPKIDLWALREHCLSEGGLINGEFQVSWERLRLVI